MSLETKNEVDALKRDLHIYREFVLRFNNVLEWEQSLYPLYMIAVITFFFLFTWYTSPAFLMIFALFGVLYFSFHLMAPKFLPVLLRKSVWDDHKEHNFTMICVRLVHAWKHCVSFKSYLCNMEQHNPKMYYPMMLLLCALLMWVGLRFNAFLLMYFISIVVCMIPGLRRNKIQDYLQIEAVKSEPVNENKNK